MADDTPSPETNAVTFKSGEVEVPLDLVARAFGLAPRSRWRK